MHNTITGCVLVFIFLSLASHISADVPTTVPVADGAARVILWHRNFDTAPVDQFVTLALAKTEVLFGKAMVVRSESIDLDVAIKRLSSGNGIDVLSVATSKSIDSNFITIQFPVLQGLLGHRLCLIRKGDQGRFNGIATSFDLADDSLSFCQGEYWPDTQVLKRNGLNVVTSTSYNDLFEMLKTKECDCFLRGAQEIVPEYMRHKSELAIEKTIAIHYFQPGVIYVSKENPSLATRIELGLLRAWDDGSYQALFEKLLNQNLQFIDLSSRIYLPLKNTELSDVAKAIENLEPLWSLPTWDD